MLLKIRPRGGLAPMVHPADLPEDMAQVAINIRPDRANLESLRGLQPAGVTLNAATRSIYKYGAAWFSSNDPATRFVDASLISDPFDYHIYTPSDYPRITRNDIATTSAPFPTVGFRLGVPQLVLTNPNCTVQRISATNSPDTETDVAISTVYRVSLVDGFGREGPLSDPTNRATYFEGFDRVVVPLNIAEIKAGHFLTNAKLRIYKLNPIADTFQFLVELNYGTASFTDTTRLADLGEAPETDGWFGPPDDDAQINPGGTLRNVVAMPGGFLVGSSGFELCASIPDAPHAWPYRIPLTHRIIGIETTGSSAVVATTGPVFVVQGSDPAALQPVRIDTNQSCMSARSMVNIGGTVIYAAPDGLVAIEGYGSTLITEEIITREEWQSTFRPSEIHAYYYEGKYVFFNNTRGWVLQFMKGRAMLFELGFVATAGFADLETDSLFLLVGTALQQFDANPTRLEYQWRSKVFRFDTPMNFGMAQVIAQTYPVTATFTFRLPNNTTRTAVVTFNSMEPRYMPSGYSYIELDVAVTGRAVIRSIALAHSALEFQRDNT